MFVSKKELERKVVSCNKEETNNLAIDLNEIIQELFKITDNMLETLKEFKSEDVEVFEEKLSKIENDYIEIVK